MADSQRQAGNGEDFLGDIPVEVVIELGRIRMVLRDVAALSEDHIIELDQPIDRPLDVVVGGKLLARGILEKPGEQLLLRITEVMGKEQ